MKSILDKRGGVMIDSLAVYLDEGLRLYAVMLGGNDFDESRIVAERMRDMVAIADILGRASSVADPSFFQNLAMQAMRLKAQSNRLDSEDDSNKPGS